VGLYGDKVLLTGYDIMTYDTVSSGYWPEF